MSPLTSASRRWILQLARGALEAAACGKEISVPTFPSNLGSADQAELERRVAAFVSLHKQGRLRGCVGHTAFDTPLTQVVVEMTYAAAREDTRFPPVEPEEVLEIRMEISRLSPFFPIEPAKVIPGTHGVIVRQGFRRGLLLPQVATSYGWDAAQFLREACRKAGLPADAWKRGAQVEAFTADVIVEDRG